MLANFERRILRRIFGGVFEYSVWRIRTNRELAELFDSPNVLEELRARRLQWLGHVARMPSTRAAAKAGEIQPRGLRPLGRPRRRWADQTKDDLRASGLEVYSVRGLERSEFGGSHGCPGRLWDRFLWQVNQNDSRHDALDGV